MSDQVLSGYGHDIDWVTMVCTRCGEAYSALAAGHKVPLCLGPREERRAGPAVTTRRTRVYISGPLTTGMLTANVRRACAVADELLAHGYAVYVPHTNVLWEMISPPIDDFTKAYEKWLSHDFQWVLACDAILRLEGKSHGADREVELAKSAGVHIYLSKEMLLACEKPTRRV